MVTEVDAWFAALDRPDIEREIEEIHLEIAEAVRSFGPLCLASGQCCRFEAHGHRLYASGLEVARCLSICRSVCMSVRLSEIGRAHV